MIIHTYETKPTTIKVIFVDQELEKAHNEQELRKKQMIAKLWKIYNNQEVPALYRKWVREAAKLINEKEI